MWALYSLLGSWGIILQAAAIIHFIRRRPDTYWLWIILIGGGLGALVYIAMEVIPDMGLMRQSMQTFPRRRRIRNVEAIVHDNPSPGNYEELADLYLEEGRFADARKCYDKTIATSRSDLLDPYYRRAVAAMGLGDFPAAVPDLERVIARDAKYDSYRAPGLLAHAYAQTGETAQAAELFERVTAASTLSETYYNYATFLAKQQRHSEARDWAQKILAKQPTMPGYLRRRERPWFRRASGLLKRLPA